MFSVTHPRTLLSSVALLTMALSAHADPRNVATSEDAGTSDEFPVTIQVPADLLSSESLTIDSVPVIDVDDIAVLGNAEAPDAWHDDELLDEAALYNAYEVDTLDTDLDWRSEMPDLDIAMPDFGADHDFDDDPRMPGAAPGLELPIDQVVPAPAISIEF